MEQHTIQLDDQPPQSICNDLEKSCATESMSVKTLDLDSVLETAPISTVSDLETLEKLPNVRQLWKALAESGDNDALFKLEAIREANRIARRKSRQQLKARAQNGDPVALAKVARNRIIDTNAHRKRNANLRAKAASGDEEAIAKLTKLRAKDNLSHQQRNQQKRKLVDSNRKSNVKHDKLENYSIDNDTVAEPNYEHKSKPKRKYIKCNKIDKLDTNINFQAYNEKIIEVEAEIISSLSSLHRYHTPLPQPPNKSNKPNKLEHCGDASVIMLEDA